MMTTKEKKKKKYFLLSVVKFFFCISGSCWLSGVPWQIIRIYGQVVCTWWSLPTTSTNSFSRTRRTYEYIRYVFILSFPDSFTFIYLVMKTSLFCIIIIIQHLFMNIRMRENCQFFCFCHRKTRISVKSVQILLTNSTHSNSHITVLHILNFKYAFFFFFSRNL